MPACALKEITVQVNFPDNPPSAVGGRGPLVAPADMPELVSGRSRRSVNVPSARPATTSLAQCASSTTGQRQPGAKCPDEVAARGRTVAADTRPTCTA